MDSSKPHAEGETSSKAPVTCKKEDEKVCHSCLPSSLSTTSTSTSPDALDVMTAQEALPASANALQLEDVKDAIETLGEHSLPLAKRRTNVTSEDYTPRGRKVFWGYTIWGEGMTHASLRFPELVAAIHKIASTRPNGFSEEPCLSAQLNAARQLPVCKDKNNHRRIWLISSGSCEGGRLWVESPVGSHAPPTAKCDWRKALRGDFYSVREQWVSFDPQLYHCVEPVTWNRFHDSECGS